MEFPIETRRHSAAHVLAAAVQRLFTHAKFGVGPVVDNGFYYDIDIGRPVTTEDLDAISSEVKRIVKENPEFVREEMGIDEAISLFESLGQTYKVELLHDLKNRGTTKLSEEESADIDAEKPDTVSVYRMGPFVDLCRGPHVEKASQIGAWKLTKVSGAYWRGKVENPQMQRMYGFAFATDAELREHLLMLAEAEKRDHRKLGSQLDLFVFSDLVGPGLPLWTPRGTVIRNVLDEYVWSLRKAKGYERVEIPHITKKDLYERSGHWEKFKDELFKIETREGHIFAMKPMNCPHHTQIFARKMHSYREMPQRYANTTMVYRDEQTGELQGLSRVRCITQDDAHVFCRRDQVQEEMLKIWEIIETFYGTVGFGDLQVRLSFHDPKKIENYLGTSEVWMSAEDALRNLAKEKGAEATEALGEAAFYGPKIDFIAKDSIGRTWQVATIQLDMNMPDRFDLYCVNEQGEHERVVMIHAAIMGSIERFLSILIEHYAGAFPLWLAPEQVRILPVADRHIEFAQSLLAEMQTADLRTTIDDATDSVGKKIRNAEKSKIPVMLVVGDTEMEGGKLTVRRYGKEDQEMALQSDLIQALQEEIRTRK
ncbi:MAG: threonine--tRNA ligase [bacterium]|nr:threonine--tRNA ligase [bacterium]